MTTENSENSSTVIFERYSIARVIRDTELDGWELAKGSQVEIEQHVRYEKDEDFVSDYVGDVYEVNFGQESMVVKAADLKLLQSGSDVKKNHPLDEDVILDFVSKALNSYKGKGLKIKEILREDDSTIEITAETTNKVQINFSLQISESSIINH